MRTLHLLRHAKSSWDDPSLDDHDRPLAPRGERATPYVAAHMRERDITPQVLLCSSAVRTRQTLELLGDAVPIDCDVHVDEELYGASADELLAHVHALPASATEAMLIGHNPAIQRLALLLAASGERLAVATRKFPTAALATLEAPVEAWTDLTRSSARLTAFIRPDDLGAPR